MKLAIGIVNRNLPDMTDEQVERIRHLGDVFVLENGSDKDKYSKYANLFAEESSGLAWGVNHILQHCLSLGYDYIWINYNDVVVEDPDGFVDWSLDIMQECPEVGVTIVKWGSMWDINANKRGTNSWNGPPEFLISFFDDLSFIVSAKALSVTSNWNKSLTPFFDSSNYTNHYSVLAPSLALYSNDMCIVMNPLYDAKELEEAALADSVLARGHEHEEWASVKGPKDTEEWLSRFFPDLPNSMSNKQKRDTIIKNICLVYREAGAPYTPGKD